MPVHCPAFTSVGQSACKILNCNKYLALGFGRGRGGAGGGPGQGNGGQAGQGGWGGQGGPAVAAMTVERYDELLSLPISIRLLSH